MKNKKTTKAIRDSLIKKLNIVKKDPSEEAEVFELVGGLIVANKKEYFNSEVNETIKEIAKGLLKIRPDSEIYEEILIAYINQLEYKKNSGLSDKEFENLKEEIEDTIILFYANDFIDMDFIKNEGLDSVYVRNTRVLRAFEDKKISREKVVDFVSRASKKDAEITKYEKLADMYNSLKGDQNNKKIGEKYLGLIPKTDLARLYISGKLEGKDLRRFSIKPEDIYELEREELVKLFDMKYIPGMRPLNENDYFWLYGKKLTGKDILDLEAKGKVREEKIIILSTIGFVDKENEEKALKPEEFLEFYNAERLLRLADKEEINKRFLELWDKKILSKLPKEKVDEYYAKLISDIRQMQNDNGLRTTQSALKLYEAKILPAKVLKEHIPSLDSDIGVLTIFEESVSEKTLVKLFNENAISIETLKDIYTPDEIIGMYKKGTLSSRAILAIPKEEREIYLDVSMEEGHDETKTILELYTKYDGLGIAEVVDILKDKVDAEEIYNNLDRENLTPEKVKELFTNYLISQDELGKLRDEGIITADEYNTFSSDLDKAEFFNRLKNAGVVKATGQETMHGEGVTKGIHTLTGGHEPKKEKISIETREEVLKALGGDTNTAVIRGLEKSFNGYTIVGFEKDGLVIFENFEKARNATYIMTYQQAAYFMENLKITASLLKEGDSINYTATKSELRDTENVRRKLHSKHWAKNVADAMIELNPEVKSRLKPNGKYMDRIKTVIDSSKEEYDRNA